MQEPKVLHDSHIPRSVGPARTMQAPSRLERDALAYGESAAILAASQDQLFTFDKCLDEEHEVLEADFRVCHQIAVYLKDLTQKLPAREVGQYLPVNGHAGAWECAKQAAQAGEQGAFLLVLRGACEERALLRRLAARP